MDFSAIFQLRTKKFWWMDVIFYFVISSLIATVLCYLIFLTKNSFQREDIKKEIVALQTVGTDQQKGYEKDVVDYRNKINDFSSLLKNHEFTSNVFAFVGAQTMPNIWFKQFGLDKKNNEAQLSGESDDMDAFSRQVATFEKNKYVKNIGILNSALGDSARIEFNINLALDRNILSYLPSILETTTPSGQSPSPMATPAVPEGLPAVTNSPTNEQQSQGGANKSSEKLITSFHFLLNPEVVGVVDQTNYAVTLNVPYGTDIKNLTSSIVISPGSAVLPASNISQNFISPVTYTVTAQDGSVQNYIVKVIIDAPPKVVEKSSWSGYIALAVIILAGIIIAVIVVLFFRRRLKKQQKNISKVN